MRSLTQPSCYKDYYYLAFLSSVTMAVPDKLLHLFFNDATSGLLSLNGNEVIDAVEDDPFDPLSASRRHVLNVQQTILQKSLDSYQADHSEEAGITIKELRECLGRLGSEANLALDLRKAMDGMNDAARCALCCLVLYCEQSVMSPDFPRQPKRELEDSVANEGLDRTRLLEYFGLCQAALKLGIVKTFMAKGGSLFNGLPTAAPSSDNSQLLFPQTRLEYIQQLLAKSMGWDPAFLTKELQRIFVERDGSIRLVQDKEVTRVFQDLVQEMQVAIRTASLQMQQDQQVKLLSDLEKGGNTRVVSVQYSEFEVTPDGKQVATGGSNAPHAATMEAQMTEEEQKKQIRLASEAAVMQQEILGELLSLPEHERRNRLEEAEQVSQEFMAQVVTLPPGQERIDFLRSVDPLTSRKLAMHKIWAGLLQANGGLPPQLAPKCNH